MRSPLLTALVLPVLLGSARPAIAEVSSPAPSKSPAETRASVSGREPSAADWASAVRLYGELTKERESDLQRVLQQVLDRVLGAGESLVCVKMELDLNTRTSHSLLKAPVSAQGKLVPSERISGGPGAREIHAFNQEDSVLQHAPGSIKRLSVAVVIPPGANEELVRSLVAAAAGADPARRDQVTVLKGKLVQPSAK